MTGVQTCALPISLGCEQLPRGTLVRVRITGCDTLTLELHASLLTRLDGAPPASADNLDDSEDEAAAAPLSLAIDLGETTAAVDAAAAPI